MASNRGIDWMYQGAASKSEQRKAEEEDYLLGKEYNPSNVKTGDLAVGNESVGMTKIVESVDNRSEFSANQFGRNEGFHLKHEDPMFLVNQTRREKEKLQRKKKELFDTAASSMRGEKRNKSRRSDKRRKSKREARERSYSLSSSDEEEERRRRRKKKDKKKKRKRRRSYSSDSEDSKNRRRKYKKHGHRDRSISRSRGSSPETKSRKHKYGAVKDRSSRRDRSQSYDRNHEFTREENGSERNDCNEKNNNSSERSSEGNDKGAKQSSTAPTKAYGLISVGRSVACSRKESGSLGPDEELLAKKRQQEEEVRNQNRKRGRNHNGTQMSQEERAAALEAMKSDANERGAYLSKASSTKKVDLHDEEIQRRVREGSKEVSSFVQDMVMEANGNNLSMSEYVARNKNSIQKASDNRFL